MLRIANKVSLGRRFGKEKTTAKNSAVAFGIFWSLGISSSSLHLLIDPVPEGSGQNKGDETTFLENQRPDDRDSGTDGVQPTFGCGHEPVDAKEETEEDGDNRGRLEGIMIFSGEGEC